MVFVIDRIVETAALSTSKKIYVESPKATMMLDQVTKSIMMMLFAGFTAYFRFFCFGKFNEKLKFDKSQFQCKTIWIKSIRCNNAGQNPENKIFGLILSVKW